MNLEQFLQTAFEFCQLDRDRPVVVGFSGGPDSLCLLDSLHRAGFAVTAAHFDHRLRAESGQDVEAARALAERLGALFVTGSGDVAGYAAERGLSVEEAARILRYGFLFEQARRLEAQAVAVGHTADDQVETVLMHLLRGAGLAGLAGMPYRAILPDWDRAIPVVRPLLNTWREETVACCAERGLEPLFDRTNLDTVFFRNRLRRELVPFLETFNPQARQSIWRTAQILAGDEAVVRQAVEAAWDACLEESGLGFVALRLEPFRALLPGLQRGVLRKAASRLTAAHSIDDPERPPRDVDYRAVERGLRFLAAPAPAGQVELVQGLRLTVEGGSIVLAGPGPLPPNPAWPQLVGCREAALPVPGGLALAGGWKITSELVDVDEDGGGPADDGGPDTASRCLPENEARLDAGRLPKTLIVRCARPGDRFQPLGMERGSTKLSDFWINNKLTRRARAEWPLVTGETDIAWVPGFRIAHPYRVTEQTRQVLRLRLVKEGM